MPAGFDGVWEILGQKYFIIFGRECASAAVWMFFAMVLRFVLVMTKLEAYVPSGIVFALPYFIQNLSYYLPFVYESYPVLPTRLAESVLGRISPTRLTVVIPGHLLGCVFGTVFFKTILPFAPVSVYQPVMYDTTDWVYGMCVESLVVCLYICIVIAVPELLAVNRMSKGLLSVPIVPIMLLRVPNKGSVFNPAAQYALWYVYGRLTGEWSLQLEHIVAPIVGAIAAGLICSRMFPDDPTSWRKV